MGSEAREPLFVGWCASLPHVIARADPSPCGRTNPMGEAHRPPISSAHRRLVSLALQIQQRLPMVFSPAHESWRKHPMLQVSYRSMCAEPSSPPTVPAHAHPRAIIFSCHLTLQRSSFARRFPGLGYATAIFATYCAAEWFYNKLTVKKGGHH